MNRSFAIICTFAAALLAGCNKDDAAKLEQTAKEAADKAGTAVAEGFAAATEKATEAMKSVEGGPEMLKSISDTFGSAEKTLAGVKDSETARAAGPAMDEMIAKIQGLSAAAEKLPAEAKTALAPMIEAGIAKLKELYEKVKSIPEVETVIKPKFDELVAKVSALAGK
jgi:hypothetical protein